VSGADNEREGPEMRKSVYLAGLLAGLGLLGASGGPGSRGGAGLRAPSLFTHWTITEFQPDIPNGGRAKAIAVQPRNDNLMFVASESGGLFRSGNRGRDWKHVAALPAFSTLDVAFLPSNPQILLVTVWDGTAGRFKVASPGGVWRSTDGGNTWSQAKLPAGATGPLSAYAISIAPDAGAVYVGCDRGCLVSTDRGASWTYRD